MLKKISLLFVVNLIGFTAISQRCTLSEPIVLHPDTTRKYIQFFYDNNEINIFKTTRAIYLQKEAILFLNDFFKFDTIKQYDGIYIYFTSTPQILISEQRFKDQVHITILPRKVLGQTANNREYSATALRDFYLANQRSYDLNRLIKVRICPMACDDSLAVWPKSTINTYSITSRQSGITSNEDLFLIGNNTFQARTTQYIEDHGNELNGNQTIYTFYKREVIERLAGYIIDDPKLELIGAYFMSYNHYPSIVETVADPKQTSICFIPLKKISGKYEPQICEYINYLNKQYLAEFNKAADKKSFRERANIENHGELCPQKCIPPRE